MSSLPPPPPPPSPSSPTIPILEPSTTDGPSYEDILTGAITEIIRNFLTRINQHHLYDEEFEWTLNLRPNVNYNISLGISRRQYDQ